VYSLKCFGHSYSNVEQLCPVDDGQVKQSTGPISWAMRLAKANGGKKENAGEMHTEAVVESNSQSSGVRLPAGVSASACYLLECNGTSAKTDLSLDDFAASSSESSIKFGSIDPKQLVGCFYVISVDVDEYTVTIFAISFSGGEREQQGSISWEQGIQEVIRKAILR